MPEIDARPYTFFTSYARSIDQQHAVGFHEDLEYEVKIALGRDRVPRGFIDQSGIPVGGDWRRKLIQIACTAKSMIALLTDDYVGSEWCALEWAIFEERIRRVTPPGGSPPPCLLPFRWARLRTAPPAEVRRLQATNLALGEAYNEGYLVHMMRVDRDEYLRTCINLAELVAQAAEYDLPPIDPGEVDGLTPAFGVGSPLRTPASAQPAPPAMARRPRISTTDLGQLVEALNQVEPIGERATFRMWVRRIETVHGDLGLSTSDYPTTRLANLITRCARHPTPALLETMVGELDVFAPNDPAMPLVRARVQEIISRLYCGQ